MLSLLEFERPGIELVIIAALCDEFVVRAAFDNFAVVENDYDVGVLNGGKPVRDYKHRPSFHKFVGAALNQKFGAGIYRRSRLVHYHNGRARNGGSRNG